MSDSLNLRDYEPTLSAVLEDVLDGLTRPVKQLPAKLLYDERGSQLFERITEQKEYYPTRTETRIMRDNIDEIAALIGPRALVIEYGSGSSEKIRLLLDHLHEPLAYVPIDISREHLLQSIKGLAHAYPHLEVLPVCADYEYEVDLPEPSRRETRRIVYFPGSTIGNFDPEPALGFLTRLARLARQPGADGLAGGLLLGVDLQKDVDTLSRAYNDAQGVTAAFNLNILLRVNRELGADFDIEQFQHRAHYNEDLGRIEMHLVSLTKQSVHLGGTTIDFAEGETIWTESSYKYTISGFADLARKAGFEQKHVWTDKDDLFSVQYLTTLVL